MSEKNKSKRQLEKEAYENLPPDQKLRKDIYDWIMSMLIALVACVALFVFFIRIIDVSGTSMVPTLHHEDKMFVSNLLYKPEAGDVIVFKTDSYDPNKALVKRVIATEGQTVNIDFDNGIVYIDGVPIQEDYIAEVTHTKLDFIGPKKVPDGCVFVMGDNRNMSTDSRKAEIGMVDNRMILGRAYAIIFPISEIRWIY